MSTELMVRSEWGRCKYCPNEADVIVPVKIGSEESEERVCMGHFLGPFTDLFMKQSGPDGTTLWFIDQP